MVTYDNIFLLANKSVQHAALGQTVFQADLLINITYWFALNNVIEIQNINIALMDA